jgi:fermentation-respiration switch protein FrsA (DUF1100 family)
MRARRSRPRRHSCEDFLPESDEIVAADRQSHGLDFTGAPTSAGVAVGMDGEGAWRDNLFAERAAVTNNQVRGGLPERLRQRYASGQSP